MEKQIKNYLKYYIGCEVKVGKEIRILKGILPCEGSVMVSFDKDGVQTLSQSMVKPILRRLSNMTFDEFVEGGKIHVACGGKIVITFDEIKKGDIETPYPAVFHYLLSKGFDLWNLIDEGLALEAETITTKS